MTISNLLFELSSSIRLDMLHALETEPLTFTKIVQKMDLTSSETSRHLERLIGMKLIEKFVNGGYFITPPGRLILLFLPGMHFISKNSDYLLSHDTSPIPYELIMRFGDFSSTTFIENTVDTMNFMQKRIQKAKKYQYVMSDGVFRLFVPFVVKKVGSGVRFCMIFPESYKSELSATVDEYAVIEEGMHRIKFRTLKSIPLCVGITDCGGALKLPDFDGNVDHSTMLVGSDPAFSRWCCDLFMYYWEKAEPI
jgi:predicted transcriptional regulator